jgi:hypothetical protein
LLKSVKAKSYSSLAKYGILIILCVVAIALVDTVISNISDFQYDEKYNFLKLFLSTQAGTAFFVALSAAFIAVQFVSLYYIRQYLRYESRLFAVFYKIALSFHFAMIAILIIAVATISINNQYPFELLEMAVGIGSTFASIVFFLLSKKLFDWYRKVGNKVILVFALAFLLLGATKIIFELGIFFALYDYNEIITPLTIVEFPDYKENAFLSFFEDAYWILAPGSFFLLWLGTVFLIQSYKKMIGRNKYRLLTVLSIIIFAPTPIGIYVNESDIGNFVDPVAFYTFTTFNATIAAILFFVTFSSLSKSIAAEHYLKNYLFITGLGLFLYFISDQATIEQHPFPPYGLITLVFLCMSSYLVFVGLLSSAISISRNADLRKTVLTILKQKFLYDISLGQLQSENEMHVRKIMQSIQDSNLATDVIPLESNEVNEMVDNVLSQLQDIKLEEDLKKGYYSLQLNCVKCHKFHRIHVRIAGDVPVDSTNTEYPKSDKLKCEQCGSLISFSGTNHLVVGAYTLTEHAQNP